jgi:sigma-54 dependent transcriptional regulator, flagellar regulatory protein
MTTHWAPNATGQENAGDILPQVERLLVGSSAGMKQVKRLISMVAPAEAPVMVQGETGVGKELVAEALHAASGRSGPIVAVNCAAIPSELLESELFGHEKGAFTGAEKRRIGRVEMAAGGTLFLDEIGDMPLALQAKLLRVLESKRIQRVGGNEEIPVNFRLVTATHRTLANDVEAGRFRADLYFRINVFPLMVPRLADRAGDIAEILERMIDQQTARMPNLNAPHFTLDAIRALCAYSWPGNVRELRNLMERALVMFPGRLIQEADVKVALLGGGAVIAPAGHSGTRSTHQPGALPGPDMFNVTLPESETLDLRGYLRDIEAALIESALRQKDGCVSHAADALRLQRTTLIEKIKKLGIEKHAARPV